MLHEYNSTTQRGVRFTCRSKGRLAERRKEVWKHFDLLCGNGAQGCCPHVVLPVGIDDREERARSGGRVEYVCSV